MVGVMAVFHGMVVINGLITYNFEVFELAKMAETLVKLAAQLEAFTIILVLHSKILAATVGT